MVRISPAGTAIMLALAQPMLAACVASTLADVVTAPVKVVGKGVDLATTSQSEADERRGREMRRREETLGKLERDQARHAERCRDGDEAACERARENRERIRDLLPRTPYEAD